MRDVPVLEFFYAVRKVLHKVDFEVDMVDFTKYFFTVKFEIGLLLGVLLYSKFKTLWGLEGWVSELQGEMRTKPRAKSCIFVKNSENI